MCFTQEQTSHYMRPMSLHLLSKEGIRATGGDDVVKNYDLLALEKGTSKSMTLTWLKDFSPALPRS